MQSIWNDLLGSEVRFRGSKYKTRTIEMGSGEPLILIHGVGGHAEAYSRNIKRLAQTFRVIAIDLLWHGFSSQPEFEGLLTPHFVDQVLDLADSMHLSRFAIEGESLGGWVAMAFALKYPERVKALILNTTAGIELNTENIKIDAAGGHESLRDRSIAAIRNPTRETVRKRLEWLMASPDRVTEELIDLRYQIYSNPETQNSLAGVFERSFGRPRPGALKEEDLAKLVPPTLVLWSEKNPGTGEDFGERVAQLIPNSKYHSIKDAAHWPQWEKSEEHDAVVKAFLLGV